VIAGVLVLLAIVAVINIAVFKPGRRPERRAAVRVQASQPLPTDLVDLRGEATPPRGDLAAWAPSATPRLKRDPFGTLRDGPSGAPLAAETEPPPAETGPAPLVCNAILLVGDHPTAVINGQSYRVGDACRAYQVAAIGSLGVKLTSNAEPELFLSVHSDGQAAGQSRIITEKTKKRGLGQTSLVEYATGERK
jgi:hypothetical protein